MKIGFKRLKAALSICLFVAVSQTALASMNERELAVAGRAIAALEQMPDVLRVGIVFDDDSGRSASEAEALRVLMQDGFEAGRITLKPVPIHISELRTLDHVDIALVTGGLHAYHKTIAAATSARKQLSISADLNCVKRGYCVLGVEVRPRLNLLVNAELADKIGVSFGEGMRIN